MDEKTREKIDIAIAELDNGEDLELIFSEDN